MRFPVFIVIYAYYAILPVGTVLMKPSARIREIDGKIAHFTTFKSLYILKHRKMPV